GLRGWTAVAAAAFLRVLQHFLDRGFTFENTAQTVGPQRGHALLDRLLADDDRGCALCDQLANRLGDVEQFVDALAALVAGVVALGTTGTVVEVLVADVVNRKSDLAQDRLARFVGLAAVRANLAHEALAEHALQAGCDEERLDPHIDETR